MDRRVTVPLPREGEVTRVWEVEAAGLRFLFFLSSPNHILKLEKRLALDGLTALGFVPTGASVVGSRLEIAGGVMVEKVPWETEVDTEPFVGVLHAVDSKTTGCPLLGESWTVGVVTVDSSVPCPLAEGRRPKRFDSGSVDVLGDTVGLELASSILVSNDRLPMTDVARASIPTDPDLDRLTTPPSSSFVYGDLVEGVGEGVVELAR
jgi:hypothetical protein